MIAIQNVSKSYYEQTLLDNVSFSLNPRERVGIVGRNGHGKTTLFRLITGKEECDSGSIAIPRGYTIGYVTQHLTFSESTLLDEACTGLDPDKQDQRWQVEKNLTGLGFSEADFGRHPDEFSGGYQVRLHLARVLAAEPNLLLLDEPTNYLDILSIRWMIRFLNAWRNEVMIISHDRGFMDSVVTHVVGIHRCRARKIAGKTDAYYTQIASEDEVYEKQRQNAQRKQKQLEQFVTKFRAKARHASLAQSRLKTLEKMEKPEKLAEITDLSFSFNAAPFPGKHMLDAHNISFGYTEGEPDLISDFSLSVSSHDRICVIGRNGKGKTTLLKLIAGELQAREGKVTSHPRTVPGYYEQGNTARLQDSFNIEEEILSEQTGYDRKAARDICGAMMFSGDMALKKINVLSGGEKCRVLLGKLLVTPSNLLLLDEPTHHLDMSSCEAMINAVEAFEGAAIIVTHDEHFLRRVATRLVVFLHDRIFGFPGTYDEFLDRVGWDEEPEALAGREEEKAAPAARPAKGKDARKVRAAFVTKRSRVLTPLKKELDTAERKIEELEAQLKKDNEALVAASEKQDTEAIARLSRSVQDIPWQINELFDHLAAVTEKYETAKEEFEARERELGL